MPLCQARVVHCSTRSHFVVSARSSFMPDNTSIMASLRRSTENQPMIPSSNPRQDPRVRVQEFVRSEDNHALYHHFRMSITNLEDLGRVGTCYSQAVQYSFSSLKTTSSGRRILQNGSSGRWKRHGSPSCEGQCRSPAALASVIAP